MLQSKQRGTYLTNKSCSTVNDVVIGVTKSKLEDMACAVAAPDASPSATVLLAVAMIWLLPQVEDACRVAGDAVLEGQQGVPLVWYAGCAGIGVGMSGMRRKKLQVAAACRSCTNLGPAGRRMVGSWTGDRWCTFHHGC